MGLKVEGTAIETKKKTGGGGEIKTHCQATLYPPWKREAGVENGKTKSTCTAKSGGGFQGNN